MDACLLWRPLRQRSAGFKASGVGWGRRCRVCLAQLCRSPIKIYPQQKNVFPQVSFVRGSLILHHQSCRDGRVCGALSGRQEALGPAV